MDMVMGALGELPAKLLELLKDEYMRQTGVKEEIISLTRELESAQAALRMVGEVQPDQLDELIRNWAREVREASYHMEDVLDTFLVRMPGHEPADGNWLQRLLKNTGDLFTKLKARHEIAGAIQVIKKQLQELSERRARYKIDETLANKPAAARGVDPRLSALYTKASQLVGIEEPRDALVGMLSARDDDTSCNKLKIISIVGFGGLGKTTLAKTVYDKVNPQFDCGAFVLVGRNPDPRKVLRQILVDVNNFIEDKMAKTIINKDKKTIINLEKKRYTGIDLIELDEIQLIGKLHRFLQERRYFIVVDDIWDTSIWGIIRNAFVDNNSGSRIVATSRNSQVSEEIGDVYRIKELSDSDSRILLYTRTFGGEDRWPENDEVAEVSHRILHKCHGVPLAIVTMASLLASKHTEEWPHVYNSIGFGHGDNTQVRSMKKILSFSYYDLPCHLRTCMLYVSVFPEDYYVAKEELIWRWIAEDLVHTEEGKTLFEVADSYFNELINRGMILPKETDGIITGCLVHDMVLHMIRDMSRQEGFSAVLDSEHESQGNVRRLALHRAGLTQVNDIGMTQVRSCNAIMCRTTMVPPVSGFRFLRVLSLEHCRAVDGYHDIENVGKLIHLRYLGLIFTPVRELPEEIGNLKFLQTLMLDGTGIEELPSNLGQLTKLMCLHADENTRVPNWIGKLTSLVELEMYPGAEDMCFVKELDKLRDLRVLRTRINIQDEGQAKDLLESLSNLQKIEIISVESFENAFELEDAFMQPSLVFHCNLHMLDLCAFIFSRLPVSINHQTLPNLRSLSLSLSELEQQDMEIIGRLKKLCFLDLFVLTQLSSTINICSGYGFQSLKTFHASFCALKFEQGAMPRLEAIMLGIPLFEVRDDNLGFNFGLGNLSSLKQFVAFIFCSFCSPTEVEEVEAELLSTVDIHPNRPTFEIRRAGEDRMVIDSDYERLELTWNTLSERVSNQEKLHDAVQGEVVEIGEKIYLSLSHPNKKWFLAYLLAQVQWFHEQFDATRSRVNHELLAVREDTPIHHLDRVMEEKIAAMERALNILTVEYPRFKTMLEELRNAFIRQGDTPRLDDVINVNICVRDVKAGNLSLDFGLGNLSSLKEIKAHIDCYMCFPTEMQEVEAELRHAVDIHPNRPTLEIIRYWEDEMVDPSNSSMLERQKLRWRILWGRFVAQVDLYKAMRREVLCTYLRTDLNLSGSNNEVTQFDEQLIAALSCAAQEQVQVQEDIPEDDRDLNRVMGDIAATERALNILTVEYPRFEAMLEELRNAFSVQREDDVTDMIVDNVTIGHVADEEVPAASGPDGQGEEAMQID